MEDGVRNSADQVKTAEIKAVHHVPGNDALDQVEVIRIATLWRCLRSTETGHGVKQASAGAALTSHFLRLT
jgi:hypothetical protein